MTTMSEKKFVMRQVKCILERADGTKACEKMAVTVPYSFLHNGKKFLIDGVDKITDAIIYTEVAK